MNDIFLSPYDPKKTEDKIYEIWLDSGFFNPDVCIEKGVTKKDAEHFSIVLPPPNATGTLHMGHAFEDTIQDVMIRYKRMTGKRTLWVPGTDHAATATAKLDGLRAAAERTIALLKERRAALIAAAVTGKIGVPTRPASGKTGAPYQN